MKNQITCPNCQTEINVEKVLAQKIEASLAADYNKKLQALEDQKQDQEKLIAKAIKEKELELRKKLKSEVAEDFEAQIKSLQEERQADKAKLRKANQYELELRKREEALNEKMENVELEIKRQMAVERETMEKSIREKIESDAQMKIGEKDLKINQLKQQVDEMQRKIEQGSMQAQGEVQEIALESLLAISFPADNIDEVKKGANGADCVQTVRNSFGKECGSIIFESKRTKAFSDAWIKKLKEDQRRVNADVAVIVTEATPKDMDQFGPKDGVWICSFSEARALVTVLREGILCVDGVRKAQENQGDKMVMLYDFLTSSEFTLQVKAMISGFDQMKETMAKQRKVMESTWGQQQGLLVKMLKNTIGIYGRVRGIAGAAVEEIEELEPEEETLKLN